jgi:hypothetical protein
MARRLLALGDVKTMTADLRAQAGSLWATRPMTEFESDAKDSCDEAPHPHWLFQARLAAGGGNE